VTDISFWILSAIYVSTAIAVNSTSSSILLLDYAKPALPIAGTASTSQHSALLAHWYMPLLQAKPIYMAVNVLAAVRLGTSRICTVLAADCAILVALVVVILTIV